MTAIVGICDGRSVWMGADAFAGNGDYVLQTAHPKIIERSLSDNSKILFGCSASFREMWLLETLPIPEFDSGHDAILYIGIDLVNAMRRHFEEAGAGQKDNGRDTAEIQMLIGFNGRLFSLWGEDYTVVETSHRYMAMGAGMYICLGALAATPDMEPYQRLETALEAAEKHNAYVRRPFTYMQITK